MTKAMLQQRCRQLAIENSDLRRHLDSLTDEIVPYTAEAHIRPGTTVMVRVPRRYVVRPLTHGR